MCLSLLCCCLGPGACGLCCGLGSKAKSSVTTRLLYVLFLFFSVVVSAIMLSPHVQAGLAKVPILCQPLSLTIPTPDVPIDGVPETPDINVINVNNYLNCSSIVGYLAVYRINMAIASFFFLLTLIMLCVFSSKDPRSYVQNGFWLIKWLLVIGLIVGFFFIPEGQNFAFGTASLVIGMIGAILFIIIQVLLLVDFAHTAAEKLLERAEENKWWYLVLAIPTGIFYFISLVGLILLYVFFANSTSCGLNIFFVSSTFVFSVVISVIAVLPWVQRVQPRSGLLQASVVSLYGTYLTWSALATAPYGNGGCDAMNNTVGVFGHSNDSALAASIIGIVVLLVTVAYTCFHLSTSNQMKKFRGGAKDDEGSVVCCDFVRTDEDKEDDDGDDDNEDESRWHMSHNDDEKNGVTYSYSFFHFLMLIATLYLMMQLTNWAKPGNADSERFQNTIASTWVKMATSWFSFAIYTWTLVAPLILWCRDFGYSDD